MKRRDQKTRPLAPEIAEPRRLRWALLGWLSLAGCGTQIELPTAASSTSATTTTGAGASSNDATSTSGSGVGGAGASSSAATGSGGSGTGGAVASSSNATGSGGAGAACAMASDCPLPTTSCQAVACEQGQCVVVSVPAGTPILQQTAGDCAVVVCDGVGGQTSIAAPDDVEDDGLPCTLDACDAMTPTHTPLTQAPCYTGPVGTLGVGLCAAGVQLCDGQGSTVGACQGDVTPQPEVCDPVGIDENCDGQVNEAAAGCVCGDGIISYPEQCDDGNTDPDDGCTPLCQPPRCGDGFVQLALGEECDDGGTSDGDACSSSCKIQRVLQVTAGSGYACALLQDGRVKCWGESFVGQLGLGDTSSHGTPPNSMGQNLPAVDLGTGRTARAISAGLAHTCALLDDATVKCWGQNLQGQLGLGDTAARGDGPGEMGDHLPAVELGTGRTAVAVAAGANFTCALLDDGRVKCWGYNGVGQLGLGDKQNRGDAPNEMGDNLPAADLGTGKTALTIATGIGHACAILGGGALKCWGANFYGALGLGDVYSRGDDPHEMGDMLPVIDLGAGAVVTGVAAGDGHTCARLADGRMKCWGANTSGMLGVGDGQNHGDAPYEMSDVLPAVDLGAGEAVVAISAAQYHTCAIVSGGAVKCWGDGSAGQLGLENQNAYGYLPSQMGDNLPAVSLGTGKRAVALTAFDAATCALFTDGSVKCWGQDNSGQLGFPTSFAGGQPGTMGDNLPTVKLFSDQW